MLIERCGFPTCYLWMFVPIRGKNLLYFKEVADYGVTVFPLLYQACHYYYYYYYYHHHHHHHHHYHYCGCFSSTKEIRFSLPTLRHASSLGDLLPGDNDADSDHDTDSLVPASVAHTQRSHSFSKFISDESSVRYVCVFVAWLTVMY